MITADEHYVIGRLANRLLVEGRQEEVDLLVKLLTHYDLMNKCLGDLLNIHRRQFRSDIEEAVDKLYKQMGQPIRNALRGIAQDET